MFAEWIPKEQMNETPWSIYECPPYTEWHHYQPFIWIQTLPSPNSYLWLEAEFKHKQQRPKSYWEILKANKQVTA